MFYSFKNINSQSKLNIAKFWIFYKREIFVSVLFSPFLLPLSVGKFRTGHIFLLITLKQICQSMQIQDSAK